MEGSEGSRDRGKGGRVGGSEGTREGRRETQCSVSGVAMHIIMPVVV